MGNIRVMNAELVGRIAAGEVVERPASVVKELMENSIDAGARMIRVNVEQGGQRLIQVMDDGCGMDRQDAMLCLEAHATSKITTTGDVGQIATLGFRGEALPSVASVSRFSIQTRRPEDMVGTEVCVEFGAIRDVRDCGCASGTNIRVSHLFANLPARRKFLRGPDTEDGYIEEMVRSVALSRPDVSMTLTVNGREILRTPATADVGQRIASVLGKEIYQAMLPFEIREDNIAVHGYVTRPGFTRGTRREQRIIVNGRTASAEAVFFAIRDAFDQLVMKGRYPGAVIYIEVPPDFVDVNVHPTKREVRFREPHLISQIVCAGIRCALRGMAGEESGVFFPGKSGEPSGLPVSQPSVRPSVVSPVAPSVVAQGTLPMELPIPEEMPAHVKRDAFCRGGTAPCAVPPPAAVPPAVPMVPPVVPSADAGEAAPAAVLPPMRQGKLEGFAAKEGAAAGHLNLKNIRLLGRLGNGYALAETGNGLVVIHLRAAHQRVIFERFLYSLNHTVAAQQPLLLATTVHLGPDDARFLRQQLEHFRQIGFQIEPFGGNSFVITAVPASLPDMDLTQMLRNILDDLRQCTVTNRQSAVHLAQVASRHAVRDSQALSEEEVRQLLTQLQTAEMPYTDPWGHPTMVLYSYQELERRFR